MYNTLFLSIEVMYYCATYTHAQLQLIYILSDLRTTSNPDGHVINQSSSAAGILPIVSCGHYLFLICTVSFQA